MYKTLLILKYLRKRRIAWVSLVAVMLCTTMVLVVISIMGGWLRMFREQFKGVSGDVIVSASSMVGFPGYEDMLKEIRGMPDVKAAAPVVSTFGLININDRIKDGVMVYGYPPDIQDVNSFRDSCYLMGGNLQGVLIADQAKDRVLAAKDPEKAALSQENINTLAGASKLGLVSGHTYYPFTLIGSEVARRYLLKTPGATPQVRIRAAEDDDGNLVRKDGAIEIDAVTSATETSFNLWPDGPYFPPPGFKLSPDKVLSWKAMVVGSGVVGIRKDAHGKIQRPAGLLSAYVDLTVVPTRIGGGKLDVTDLPRQFFWIIDDSRTKVYLYDSKNVYVSFSVLQRLLDMDAHDSQPARCSAIQVALRPGVDANTAAAEIRKIVDRVFLREQIDSYRFPVEVRTWEQQHATFIGAVEKEKFLVTFLFGIISVVAVFLIFCIFYMIVVEKTRDIGIIKSVGAGPFGVAGIFLGYGLVIGILGAAMGLGLSWLIVHYINQIHSFLGARLGIVVWNPEVYLFDTIPNTMNPPEVLVIVSIAIIASVLGALVPAIRAANMHPVEALRWE